MTKQEQYRATLSCYLPEPAVEPIYAHLDSHAVRLHITRSRSSKLGDYRWPQPRHPYHEISINGDLPPGLFLLVMLHEMAHLEVHLHYKNIAPHGHEWQATFAQLLKQHLHCFPPDLQSDIDRYASRIPLERKLGKTIEQRLNNNGNADECRTVANLAPGDEFALKHNGRRFRYIEHRRTRTLCLSLDDGRRYLVSDSAEVAE